MIMTLRRVDLNSQKSVLVNESAKQRARKSRVYERWKVSLNSSSIRVIVRSKTDVMCVAVKITYMVYTKVETEPST